MQGQSWWGVSRAVMGKRRSGSFVPTPGASGEEPSRARREGSCLAPGMLSKGSPRGVALKGDELVA